MDAQVPDAPGEVILVVDDDSSNRTVAARMFARLGRPCETACDGADALAVLGDARRFAAIVTDLDMPAIDGLKLIQRLRERTRSLPIVLVSSLLSSEASAEARARGADATYDKSIGWKAIVREVEDLIARSRGG